MKGRTNLKAHYVKKIYFLRGLSRTADEAGKACTAGGGKGGRGRERGGGGRRA